MRLGYSQCSTSIMIMMEDKVWTSLDHSIVTQVFALTRPLCLLIGVEYFSMTRDESCTHESVQIIAARNTECEFLEEIPFWSLLAGFLPLLRAFATAVRFSGIV